MHTYICVTQLYECHNRDINCYCILFKINYCDFFKDHWFTNFSHLIKNNDKENCNQVRYK